jgi:hypothetical protein
VNLQLPYRMRRFEWLRQVELANPHGITRALRRLARTDLTLLPTGATVLVGNGRTAPRRTGKKKYRLKNGRLTLVPA